MSAQRLPVSVPPAHGPLYSLYSFCEEMSWGEEPADCKYAKGESGSKSALIYINGVRQKMLDIDCVHHLTSKNTQKHTYTIANVTNGIAKDFFRCVKLWLGGQSPASLKLKETLESLPDNITEIKILCHSEGSLITRQALHNLPHETFVKLYPKLNIVSLGAPFFFDRRYASKIENHLSIYDPVSFILNPFFIFRYIWASIVLLKNKLEGIKEPVKIGNYCPLYFYTPHSNRPIDEHSLYKPTLGMTYMNHILDE